MNRELLLIIITLTVFIIFLVWELIKPARVYEQKRKQVSYLTNTGIFLLNNVLMYVLGIAAVFVFVSTISFYNIFGATPVWLQYVLGILFLDFTIWFWHMINHKVPLLWSFHQAHHAEKYLNTTSALRFHIGELLLSVMFKSLLLVLFGIPVGIFLLYESLITMFSIFHHANIRLSKKVQNILEYIIITPRLHQTHHSDKRREHDSNYGVIFSWWDTILKTKNHRSPEKIGLRYGGEKNLWTFLIMPIVDRD